MFGGQPPSEGDDEGKEDLSPDSPRGSPVVPLADYVVEPDVPLGGECPRRGTRAFLITLYAGSQAFKEAQSAAEEEGRPLAPGAVPGELGAQGEEPQLVQAGDDAPPGVGGEFANSISCSICITC